MKQISRRDFLCTGSAAAAVALTPSAQARFMRGSAPVVAPVSAGKNSSTINVNNIVYLNVMKGAGFIPEVNNQNANGYPVTAPTSARFINTSVSQSYFGQYVLKWTGTGGFFMANGLLIYSGGGDIQNGKTTTGSLTSTGGNTTINGPSGTGAANPRIVFAFGFPATNVAKAPSTNLIRISSPTGYMTAYSTGDQVLVQNVGGQLAANGTWTITVIDAQTIELQGSTWNAGTPYTSGGEVICPARGTNTSWYFLPSGSGGVFSSFDNMVICQTGNEAAITAGQTVDPSYISQINYLKPGWLRMMDACNVQNSWQCDFSARQPVTAVSFGGNSYTNAAYIPTPTAGINITNSGGDAYTCSDPSNSVWSGSEYIDSAIVQGVVDVTNAGVLPTLNVGGHGAKPIVDNSIRPFRFVFSSAPASAGLTMTWRFTASYFAGGFYDFTYTTVAGDVGNLSTFQGNLDAAIGLDSTLAAGNIFHRNSGGIILYYQAAPVGVLTIAYTAGPAICTVTRIDPGGITTNSAGATFVYSKLLGAWIYAFGGMSAASPFEVMVELCNRTNSNCWICWPILTKGAWITAVTNFFGDATTGLTSGLQFGTEISNEVWNFGAAPYGRAGTFGSALGINVNSNKALLSWTGAKTKQCAVLSRAAWAGKGRTASDHYILQMSQVSDFTPANNTEQYQFAGTQLLTSNTVYATYGGLGATAATDGASAGNRPIDSTDAIGFAPYWAPRWFGTIAGAINGTVAANAVWLQAGLDYTNGSTTAAYNAFANMVTDTVALQTSQSAGEQTYTDYQKEYVGFLSVVSGYDSYRLGAGLKVLGVLEYEGGSQFAIGSSSINGTNSATDSISALATKITALGWDVSPYTVSTTNNATECATQVNAALYNFKFSTQYYTAFKLRYTQMVGTFAGREARPAQYGYTGNIWSLYPSDAAQAANLPYASAQAIHDFNNAAQSSYYEGLVSTRGMRMMGGNSSAANKQIMSRNALIASENLTSIRILFQNFYNCTNFGGAPITDTSNGGTTTITAAIEYNGVSKQLKFTTSPVATGTIPAGGTLWSNYVGMNIPAGATFWVRTFTTTAGANGVIYNNFLNTFLGECSQIAASGLTDLTLSTGTFSQSGASWTQTPLAVVGITNNPSMVIVGDSITAGQADTEDTSSSATGYNGKVGTVARSLSCPFVIIARSGAMASAWSTEAVAANAVIQNGSHLFIGLGTNDINASGGNQSSATVVTNIGTIMGLARQGTSGLPGQRVFVGTLPPRSSGSWGTLVAQTTVDNTTRQTLNTAIKAIPTGFPSNVTGKFDIGGVFESSAGSGLWLVTPTPPYTGDGVHPSPSGYLLVPSAGVISPVSWP